MEEESGPSSLPIEDGGTLPPESLVSSLPPSALSDGESPSDLLSSETSSDEVASDESAPKKRTKEEAKALWAEIKDDLDHEDFKDAAEYNKSVQRRLGDLDKQQKQVQVDNQMQLFADFFEKLTPDQLNTALRDQSYGQRFRSQFNVDPATAYSWVERWKQQKAAQTYRNDASIAEMLFNGWREALDESGKFAPVVAKWDAITSEASGDAVKFLTALLDASLKDERSKIEKAAEVKWKAHYNNLAAKNFGTNIEATDLPAGTGSGNGFSMEHLMSLHGAEREKYEKEHKAALEAILEAGWKR